MIGEEDRVQFAAFGDPGQFEVVADVGDARQPGLRQPPGRFMLTDVAEKGVEVQSSCAGSHSRRLLCSVSWGVSHSRPAAEEPKQFRSAKFKVFQPRSEAVSMTNRYRTSLASTRS